jgi:hypothetical protein
VRVVTEPADAGVALAAKQSANTASCVIMIDVGLAIPPAAPLIAADDTSIFLLFAQC